MSRQAWYCTIHNHVSNKDDDNHCAMGLGHVLNYHMDQVRYGYDKLCMITVGNADALFAILGSERCLNYLEGVISDTTRCLQKHGNDKGVRELLSPYIINAHSIVIAGKPALSEQTFLDLMRILYQEINYRKAAEPDIWIVARCVVVLNRADLLDCAVTELKQKQNSQERFILYDGSRAAPAAPKQELEMANIIHWAIEHGGVIPFYQGIYDNRKKRIDKYESLMRIKDEQGNLYNPASFMEIAKKYHMYIQLNKLMLGRVFEDAEENHLAVSINLSSFDIHSGELREVLFDGLKKGRGKGGLVIEILEDEIFHEMKTLKRFLSDVREFGVKIAMDDFGAGYSSMLKIAQISPDFIKIDGEIVRKSITTLQYKAVLESIVCLAGKIDAKMIAEYVENEEIQNYVNALEIDYSQGFYFARPAPVKRLTERDIH